jgi:hypothetical protein
MKRFFPAACCMALLATAADAQLSPPSLTPSIRVYPTPTIRQPTPPVAATPAPACTATAIYSVDSLALDRSGAVPVIRAVGTVRSGGWSNGRLVPTGRSSDGAVFTYRFTACPPRGLSTQALARIEARKALGGQTGKLRAIVVVADTNSETLEVTR